MDDAACCASFSLRRTVLLPLEEETTNKTCMAVKITTQIEKSGILELSIHAITAIAKSKTGTSMSLIVLNVVFCGSKIMPLARLIPEMIAHNSKNKDTLLSIMPAEMYPRGVRTPIAIAIVFGLMFII